MGWKVDLAVKQLQDGAKPGFGVGKCATFVREAIEAGGVQISRTGSGSAKDYGPRLKTAGFQPASGKAYRAGDVAVIDGFSKSDTEGVKKDHPDGHMAMYDGQQWISDFKQSGQTPYPGRDYTLAKPEITIYRYVPPAETPQ